MAMMKVREVEYEVKGKPAKRYLVQFTEDGKRKRKFFPTKTAANSFVAKKTAIAKKMGTRSAKVLTEDAMEDAAKSLRKLAKYDAGLLDAVDYFLERSEIRKRSTSLKDAVKEFIDIKKAKKRRARTIRSLESRLNSFAAKMKKRTLVADIDQKIAEHWLDGLKVDDQTYNNYRTDVRSFFRWAVTRGYTDRDPFAAIERKTVESGEPGIFTPQQMAVMLTKAKALKDNKLIAWLAIGGFAGLRSSEIERLDWSQIHFDSRVGDLIDLTASNTKKAKKRKVKMLPVLRAWLEPIRLLGGPVVTGTYGSGNKELKAFKHSLAFEWPHNGLRHSYATYHLIEFKNAGETSLELGHTGSPALLHNHYNKPGVDTETATQWWSLLPNEAEAEAKRQEEAEAAQ